MSVPPLIWSVAGVDSGGGAGLSADQRAAEALGVHLCPVPAALTAQNSLTVAQVQAVDTALLRAQLDTLESDLPPRAIKTGLLGSAANARALADTVDRLRARRPLPLVVDPVLRASTGAALSDADLRAAWRRELLPRATVLTPNRREALALLGLADGDPTPAPPLAEALAAMGPTTVVITGGDDGGDLAADWLHAPQARGWLYAPRVDTAHHHGTGCTFASALAAALALGWVAADAAVLAKLLTTHALRRARPLGAGAGPVRAAAGFATDAPGMPRLTTGAEPPRAWAEAGARPGPGLYAIADTAARVDACLAAGADTVQLRLKADPGAPGLRDAVAQAIAAGRRHGRTVVVNDHWQLAIEHGAAAVHLGQEDWLALLPAERAALQAARDGGLQLGLSSHSLWELCRARDARPDLIACGPVWPTTTKAMPWQPQGLDNLAWWAHMAGAPVVAIGGILAPAQLREAARCGVAGACVVRGLGNDPAQTLPAWRAAWEQGRAEAPLPVPALPHPTLAGFP